MSLLCKPIRKLHNVAVSQPYVSLEATLHDVLQDADGPSPEISLMLDFLAGHPGVSLEIGCGTGRLLKPLRDAGLEVEGLELSTEMISQARPEIATCIHQGDMSQWTPVSPYASLLVPSFTLQLAENPVATLKHWHGWLQVGGGLYLTTFVPYGELIGELPEGEWYLDHEATLTNGDHAILETRHELHDDEQKITRHHRYRIKDRPEILHECTQTIRWGEPSQWKEWLVEAGFQVTNQFLDFDKLHTDGLPGPEDYDGIATTFAYAMKA